MDYEWQGPLRPEEELNTPIVEKLGKNPEELDFETLGFFSVVRLPAMSKNEIYTGQTEDGRKCFIKRYVIRPGREAGDMKRPGTEISCYNNLKNFNLPEVIGYDYDKKYLAVEYVELAELELSEWSMDEVVDFFEQRALTQDCSFLPELDFQYYENELFPRLREMMESGLIPFAEEIIEKIKSVKDKIENAQKYFSHHDFNLANIKKSSNGITLIDFEFACRDNAMYDLATLYVDLENRGNIQKLFLDRIRKMKVFDQELFDVMCIKKSVEVVWGLKNKQEVDYFRRNFDFLVGKFDCRN